MITLKFKYGRFLGKLDLTSKFTFIQGKSGTGKTTIIDIMEMPRARVVVSDGYEYHYLRGLEDYPVDILSEFLHSRCKSGKGVFIADEDDFGRASEDLQKVLMESPYLFIIAYRAPWGGISYGIDSVKKVCHKELSDGRYFYYLENEYSDYTDLPKSPSKIITEDTGAALALYRRVVGNNALCEPVKAYKDEKVIPGKFGGKSNIPSAVKDPDNKYAMIIADRLGFGSEIGKTVARLRANPTVTLYLIPSFEKMILDSEFIQAGVAKHPRYSEYLESSSITESNWEEYYTNKLRGLFDKVIDNGNSKYDKGVLPRCFKVMCCKLSRRSCPFYNQGDVNNLELNKEQLLLPRDLYEFLLSMRAVSMTGENSVNSAEEPEEKELTTDNVFQKMMDEQED